MRGTIDKTRTALWCQVRGRDVSSKRCKTTTLALLAVAISLTLDAEPVHAWTIHVTKAGSPAPMGTASEPYQTIEAALSKLRGVPHTIEIERGKYYETLTLDRPCTLTATGGTATIGEMDYVASTTLELLTLNTHLYGDCLKALLFPSVWWQDPHRAEHIPYYIRDELNSSPDVVCFQEIWDEDAFFGEPGEWEGEGILNRAGYPFGAHGEWTDCAGCLNSGLAVMSRHVLRDWVQWHWGSASNDYCNGDDCMAAKGWVETQIQKDGFSIWILNLHTDADSSSGDREARRNQLTKLRVHLDNARREFRTDVFFVMGDFNIVGEREEYYSTLIGTFASPDGRDAHRNSPGCSAHPEAPLQWTANPRNRLWQYFESADTGRLDYIFYFPSMDGKVEVLPTDTAVREFEGPNWCCCYLPSGGYVCQEDTDKIRVVTDPVTGAWEECVVSFSTTDLSDHYAVQSKFKLIRTGD